MPSAIYTESSFILVHAFSSQRQCLCELSMQHWDPPLRTLPPVTQEVQVMDMWFNGSYAKDQQATDIWSHLSHGVVLKINCYWNKTTLICL